MSLALPSQARAFQGSRAGIVSRMVAACIDFVVAAAIVVGIVVVASVWTFFFSRGDSLHLEWPSRLGLSMLTWAVLFVYLAWGWARTGKTIGKRVAGLTVVTTGGGRLPAWLAILRAFLYVIFPLGLLWCGISASQRSVQDLLLASAVVYDWRGSRRRPRQPA